MYCKCRHWLLRFDLRRCLLLLFSLRVYSLLLFKKIPPIVLAAKQKQKRVITYCLAIQIYVRIVKGCLNSFKNLIVEINIDINHRFKKRFDVFLHTSTTRRTLVIRACCLVFEGIELRKVYRVNPALLLRVKKKI